MVATKAEPMSEVFFLLFLEAYLNILIQGLKIFSTQRQNLYLTRVMWNGPRVLRGVTQSFAEATTQTSSFTLSPVSAESAASGSKQSVTELRNYPSVVKFFYVCYAIVLKHVILIWWVGGPIRNVSCGWVLHFCLRFQYLYVVILVALLGFGLYSVRWGSLVFPIKVLCYIKTITCLSFECFVLISLWPMNSAGICQWLLQLVCVHDKYSDDDDDDSIAEDQFYSLLDLSR
ncbi:hypothetical protein VNO77_34113 [Canavalia gladiata]|uniref:Uncharacterized protein n=1 Tax=Canavalia gladiata TaxID=3824 RepID=A0AAN9PWZ5_CANGL